MVVHKMVVMELLTMLVQMDQEIQVAVMVLAVAGEMVAMEVVD